MQFSPLAISSCTRFSILFFFKYRFFNLNGDGFNSFWRIDRCCYCYASTGRRRVFPNDPCTSSKQQTQQHRRGVSSSAQINYHLSAYQIDCRRTPHDKHIAAPAKIGKQQNAVVISENDFIRMTMARISAIAVLQ